MLGTPASRVAAPHPVPLPALHMAEALPHAISDGTSAVCGLVRGIIPAEGYRQGLSRGCVSAGPNSTVRRAIVDKNARIGANVQIVNKDGVRESNRESEGFVIKDGIVVVIKDSIIPDGTII